MPLDCIHVHNIAVETCIGVPDAERQEPQKLLVTLDLFHPTKEIAKNDDILGGIDYQKVTEEVMAVAKVQHKTVEWFAEDVSERILKKFKPMGGIKVQIQKKPDLPLEYICVTIHRP